MKKIKKCIHPYEAFIGGLFGAVIFNILYMSMMFAGIDNLLIKILQPHFQIELDTVIVSFMFWGLGLIVGIIIDIFLNFKEYNESEKTI